MELEVNILQDICIYVLYPVLFRICYKMAINQKNMEFPGNYVDLKMLYSSTGLFKF